jgi:hypothetical protein
MLLQGGAAQQHNTEKRKKPDNKNCRVVNSIPNRGKFEGLYFGKCVGGGGEPSL